MNTRERLDHYLDEIRRRLKVVIVARAGGAVALTALVVTLAALWALRSFGLQPTLVTVARITLAVALVVVAVAMLWRPLTRLLPRNLARELERLLPGQQGRIGTYLDAKRAKERGVASPLLDLLAEDALNIAEQAPAQSVIPPKRSLVPVAIGAGAVAGLAVLMMLGNFWGAGSRHLWFGVEIPKDQIITRNIHVKPGDTIVRRNQDLPIVASAEGFKPSEASVHVRFGENGKWEKAPMHSSEDGEFEFTLFAVREPLSYYVSSGNVRSAEHRVSVVDAPRIERIRLTYQYPEWTGLDPETTESSRDIQAVEGTEVSLEIQTSAPLDSPTLVVNGTESPLASQGHVSRGTLVVKGEGHYRIEALVGNERVPLSDEHLITLVEDQKPTIEIAKPGRDWRASSIEEVPVRVRAKDDFRVQKLELRYSVNGGEWKSTPLRGRAREVEADTLLRLEELGNGGKEEKATIPGLTPGDIVTYYAVAKDRRQAVQTDLFLIQVQPFERRFTQGAGAGMGAGAGDDQNAISERQREILLATWNLERTRADSKGREAERIRDNARMLAELQQTLASQARTLIERTRARALGEADPKIRSFIEYLNQAAQAMDPAVKHLSEFRLAEAIPAEQKALQHLLRAEALVTEIQVSFQNASAGGGQAGRDLTEMFELEMDLEKNQYETESRSRPESPSEEMNEALRKLRELAQRQERLAREAARERLARREQTRWQQEQLRREAEELRRQLEELAQRQQQQQQGNGTGQGQQGQGQRNRGGPAAEALEQLEKALENMQASATGGQQSSDPRAAEEASRNLQRAIQQIEREQREGMAGSFESLAQRARQLVEEQRKGEAELQSALTPRFGSGEGNPPGPRINPRFPGLDWERAEALAEQKRKLQSDLQALERDMRISAQRHKDDAPEASQRVGTAATDLAQSNVSAGLARSALELERGRVLQAAARESLITEILETLERDLSEAALVAANEARQSKPDRGATPEELLAELSELRRAWQQAQEQAQRGAQGAAQGEKEGTQPGQENGSSSTPGSAGETENLPRQANASGARDGGFSPEGLGGEAWDNSLSNGLRGGYSGPFTGGNRDHWNAWNPPLTANTRPPVDSPEFRAQAEETARRLREMMRRLPRGVLPDDDLAALRKLADRLRQMNREDPMEAEYGRMLGLVDQIELAALNAVEKNRGEAPRRATTPAADSPRYRENIAEYYRRLGRAR